VSSTRELLLLSAALSQSHSSKAHEKWNMWSAIRPRIDDLTPGEAQCLAAAWRAAGSPNDPDKGRIQGMEKRASVTTSVALDLAGRLRGCLQARGIPSALTGGVAIYLLAQNSPRSPLGVPELLIESSYIDVALSRRMNLRERISCYAPLDDGNVVWRSALREAWTSEDSQAILWHQREFMVPSPHRVAFDSLVRALFTRGDISAHIVAAILDFAAASKLKTFDSDAWTEMVDRNRLGSAIGSATAPYVDALPEGLIDLLRTSDPGKRWHRLQMRSLRALGVRILP